ncbi:hypothetical protein HOT82_gp108 [Gordonia phage Ronaldo]|uniref:Uncharacterized protein n=4 Tax=Ronaldovirus TaxID=2733205 RepID=A0A6B9LJV9_9CAUD|nr:hypothetical protein HOT81_gp106 [Gordonia phage Fryberger]YP_009807804.1 hypothetical protein HOT82_gp108 [Gordonia phage Ronaldo]QDH48447.1 hypothetical protein SEA_ZIKO_109 [Gordonia phage Ziko]QHB38224.1 hypothetical protein SEA_VOLT_110 [Gordonia phage Volt]QTF81894.1 hypothetical protein SEA_GUEY18_111 [Gordonia phage Guey18]AXN53522.1 hypothetical protein SEA_FRYBERGER_106 [Gordonia phage Fryberger]AXN53670.1 hypothetical protein SEA_RONALDO_108 [Gordonia phage Ronaldo]
MTNIYEDAADLIEKGWCQYSFGDDDGGYCTVGAVNKTISDSAISCSPVRVIEMAKGLREFDPSLREYDPGDEFSFVTNWNDDPTRDRQEVLDFLRFMGKKEADK